MSGSGPARDLSAGTSSLQRRRLHGLPADYVRQLPADAEVLVETRYLQRAEHPRVVRDEHEIGSPLAQLLRSRHEEGERRRVEEADAGQVRDQRRIRRSVEDRT